MGFRISRKANLGRLGEKMIEKRTKKSLLNPVEYALVEACDRALVFLALRSEKNTFWDAQDLCKELRAALKLARTPRKA